MKRWTLWLCWCLLSMVGVAQESATKQDLDAQYGQMLLARGSDAPNFQLATPQGNVIDFHAWLAEEKKPTVLIFWASWCKDCRNEQSALIALYQQYQPQGVAFMGVSFDTDKAQWENYLTKAEVPYLQVSELKRMSQSQVAADYGIQWIPSFYLISPDGKVIVSTVELDKIEKALKDLPLR